MFYTGFSYATRNCDEAIAVQYGEIMKLLAPAAKAAIGR